MTITSGKLQVCQSSDSRFGEEPTFFEHYREQLGIPQEKTWTIQNMRHFVDEESYYSEHPAFGKDYGASAWYGHRVDDLRVAEKLMEVMDIHQPSLVVAWFNDVDYLAHEGDWDVYTEAIQKVDRLIYQIWENIKSDPYYSGRTTLFITNDHGRHDDQHDGFEDHGDYCNGCRHLPFLAVGPDIMVDTVIEERGDHIDIAPTIAELLGFEMPMAEGWVLYEMFNGGAISNSTSNTREYFEQWPDGAVCLSGTSQWSGDPRIVGLDGAFHVVWMERDTTSIDYDWDVLYENTVDPGNQIRLFGEKENQTPILAGISCDRVSGDVYVSMGYWTWGKDFPGALPTYLWGISGKRKNDEDVWSEEEDIAPTVFMDLWSGISMVMEGGESYTVAEADDGRKLLIAYRMNNESPWNWRTLWNSPSIGETFEYPRLLRLNGFPHLGWITYGFRQFCPLFSQPDSPSGQPWVELGEFEIISKRHLSMDTNGETVIVCWSQVETDHWEVFWQRSTDSGMTWMPQEAVLTSSGAGAWRPSVAMSGNRVHVIWEDYRDGNAEIYRKTSTDGGATWGPDIRFTNQTSYSIRPQVAVMGGEAYVVWQDLRNGNWEILGGPILF
jgi:hypothetical protein